MKQHITSKWFGKPRLILAALILVVLFQFAGTSPAQITSASAQPIFARSNWRLVDYQQSACFSPSVTTAWYGIWIKGRWTRPIDIGISNLPSGGTYSTSYAPIPPGSSDGVYSLAYVGVQIPSTTPVGTYTASLWASDGRVTRSVPVTLDVRTRCGY
jgi:hypothetical protein